MSYLIHKLTVGQQIRMLLPMLVRYAILLSIYFYFFRFTLSTGFVWVFAGLLLIDILPVAILHVQYVLVNRKNAFWIDTRKKRVHFESPAKRIDVDINQIVEIKRFSSFGRGTGWYSFENYRYYKLTLDTQDQIVITCLMVRDIEKNLRDIIPVKEEKCLKVLALI